MKATYDSHLVLLSVAVAILVSYTALRLAARVSTHRGTPAKVWLAGGAASMGVGIWSMHFIGMIAMSLGTRLGYGVPLTVFSLVIAIATSYFALRIASHPALTTQRLLRSGVIMGAGISAMHYTGMAAIHVSPAITYDPWLVALSIAVAVIASTAALGLAFHLRARRSWHAVLARLGASFVMGSAIAGMHFIGMAAAHFHHSSHSMGGTTIAPTFVALVVGTIALGMLLVTVLVTAFDSHREELINDHAAALEKANAQLQYQATHDALTGLPNRALLQDRLQQLTHRCASHGGEFALLALDMDRFKNINDSLGHHAGDDLLKAIATRLTDTLRLQDTIARMGGDEFVMLLPDLAKGDVAPVAQRVLDVLGASYQIADVEVHSTPSIGIAIYPKDAASAADLLTRCDEAMYAAKQHGRNNYQFFSPEMSVHTRERFRLEADLRHAMEARQLELHYQPKLDVATGKVHSCEALLRWRHPLRGLIPPDKFIPLAEEVGLMLPIGEWVLEEACRQARKWKDAGLPLMRVAVNLSAVQFRQENLAEVVQRALNEAGLEPNLLELELTETCVMSNSERAVTVLERLSKMGVLISIDDFGTGYSSMSYLRRFPIDKLKVDRSFVRDISTKPDAFSIVKAIVSLAHSLQLKVIAEGVETPEQLEKLRELGCDQYQGYLASPAVAPQQFESLIRKIHDENESFVQTRSKLSAFRPRRTA